MRIDKSLSPDRIGSYFRREWAALSAVTVSGLIYNVGLAAGPYFEGRLAQCLYDIINGQRSPSAMLPLAGLYLLVIALVQGCRCVKRFYVRRFANNTSLAMRGVLYKNLVRRSRSEIQAESAGTVMTKAVADVDACAEGMRKFTTEVFDTGVALVALLGLLFYYDWRLALVSCAFTPVAYLMAEGLKKTVYRTSGEYKKSAGRLNDATLDRISNLVTYRVYGQEKARNAAYEAALDDYEKKAVRANIWEGSMRPLYSVISMTGVIFIVWLGGRNVAGTGWTSWDVGAFTAFLTCFTRMAVKSSSAAKLFNSVQKARVSWQRIKPLMRRAEDSDGACEIASAPLSLEVRGLSFAYSEGKNVFQNVSFTAVPGEIIGITGPVACGKSTLGRVFLNEAPYGGSVKLNGRELSEMTDAERVEMIAYSGHDPELISATIAENISLGETAPVESVLKTVCLTGEVSAMEGGENAYIGDGGVKLSGGQQARVALARALYRSRGLTILDDPFAAVDRKTEDAIMSALRREANGGVILLISHRLYHFPELDKVIWLDNGASQISAHAELLRSNPDYARFYRAQTEGGEGVEKA